MAYTIILRIRTLYIIKKLIDNENYLNKDFMKKITDISKGTNAYERYLAVKNNLDGGKGISVEETERLYEYLKSMLVEIKKEVK